MYFRVIKKIWTILILNTINEFYNIDNCLIFTLISHLKSSLQLCFFYYLWFYIVNLLKNRLRFCQVIYYFDTHALGRKHQLFDGVNFLVPLPER